MLLLPIEQRSSRNTDPGRRRFSGRNIGSERYRQHCRQRSGGPEAEDRRRDCEEAGEKVGPDIGYWTFAIRSPERQRGLPTSSRLSLEFLAVQAEEFLDFPQVGCAAVAG